MTLLGAEFFLNSFLICLFLPLVKDLKVWRTDPGSIFDIDPLEDNIQSRSLHMLSGTAYVLSSSPFTWLLSCNVDDLGSVPGLVRSSGGGHGNPLQYSFLESPHGQRSLVGYSLWGHKESDMTKHSVSDE